MDTNASSSTSVGTAASTGATASTASTAATPSVATPVSAPIGTGTPVAKADDDAPVSQFREKFGALPEIQRAYLEGRPFGIAADEDPSTAVPGENPGDAVRSATVKAELQGAQSAPSASPDSRASAADTRLPARPGTAGTPQK